MPALLSGGEGSVVVRRAARLGRNGNKVVRRADCIVGDGDQFAVLVHFSDGPLDCGPCVILDLCGLDVKRLTRFGEGLDEEILDGRFELPTGKFIELN